MMVSHYFNCVILADRNMATSEAIRGLLESEFDSVYLVTNTHSLTEGIKRLKPRLIVFDQLVGPETPQEILKKIRARTPDAKVIVLVIREHPLIAEGMLAAGADAVVLKRSAGTDLFEAILAIESGARYVSSSFGSDSQLSPAAHAGVHSS